MAFRKENWIPRVVIPLIRSQVKNAYTAGKRILLLAQVVIPLIRSQVKNGMYPAV